MNLKVNGTAPEPVEKQIDCRKSPMMLINEVSRLVGEKIREKGMEKPIIQKSGRLIMLELSRKDGRTQLDLSTATHLKAPTISVALQKLEKEGYVFRKPDEYDLRSTRVFLTEKGRETDNHIKKCIQEEEALIVSDLTPAETEILVKILNKIKMNILNEGKDEGDIY